jgi:dephospho-CoA kinase
MKVIGLTGNLGCGKSTVAGMLRKLGVAHIDADAVAREIRQNDGEARAAIQRRFGTLDAGSLGRSVFSDPGALRDLEAILHPRVRDAVRARLAELAEAQAPAAVVEVIKLLESPLHDALARVRESRRLTEAEARARLANQSSQEEKIAAADVVIDGSAPLEKTRRQVKEAYETLLAR